MIIHVSRLSGVCARVQGDVILDSIPWDHPWKESLERAVGDKVTNNKHGVAEIFKVLDGLYDLNLLRKRTRGMKESLLIYVNLWEEELERIRKMGDVHSNISGIDLMYSCNLIKEDRAIIKKDLDTMNLLYTTRNVSNSIRRCIQVEIFEIDHNQSLLQSRNKTTCP